MSTDVFMVCLLDRDRYLIISRSRYWPTYLSTLSGKTSHLFQTLLVFSIVVYYILMRYIVTGATHRRGNAGSI